MKKQNLFAYLAAASLALLAGIGLGAWLKQAPEISEPTAMPSFELLDLAGEMQSSEQWQGQVLLINFWATWCVPCRAEMPLLQAFYEQHKSSGLRIIGPALDDKVAVQQFIQQHDINYPVFPGGPEMFQLMDDLGDEHGALPFSVIVDRQGMIVRRHWGELHEDQLKDFILPLL